ncbi:MAG TPA: hypothetical protein VEH30_12745 [Terriglobales bacterium]|nr:hypothetical protein [Terriglobales bacterium]
MKFLAILLLVLTAFAVGNLGAIWGKPRPNGAAMFPQSTASAGKGQSDVSSLAITASAVNGVVNPAAYPGSDIGEKINNVFAKGDGCAEVHIPAGKYVYATTIRMSKPCQSLLGAGSALTSLEYSGGGDAIVWQMQPYTIQKAGILRGFTLKGPGNNVQNGIRSGTVIGATFADLVIDNFRGPNSTAILLENLMAQLPAWTERTVIRDVHIGIPHIGNTTAMAFVINGGSNSFGYTDISDVWLNVEKGQVGVRWAKGTYTYNSTLNFHANISALGTDSFLVDGIIRNSQLHLTGEAGCAKDLVHVGPEGQVQAEGIVAVNCASELTKGNYVRTDLSGVQVDNQRWDAFQLSPAYEPLINGKGVVLMNNLERHGEADLTNYYGPEHAESVGGFSFYNTFASIASPRDDAWSLLARIDAKGNWKNQGSLAWGSGASIPSSDSVAMKAQLPLAGKTAAIGGNVKAGNCIRGTASVAGAMVGEVVAHPAASDGSMDLPFEIVSGAVTAANTVTVQRCANAAAPLPAKTYNVRVIP